MEKDEPPGSRSDQVEKKKFPGRKVRPGGAEKGPDGDKGGASSASTPPPILQAPAPPPQIQNELSSLSESSSSPPGPRGGTLPSPGPRLPQPVPLPPSEPLIAERDDFRNEVFQRLLAQEDSVEKFRELQSLANSFINLAETYGRTIINEKNFAPQQRTIKPLGASGAGGRKYMLAGIMFKFALDQRSGGYSYATQEDKGHSVFSYIYGSQDTPNHEKARKAALNELKGVSAVQLSEVEGLHFPLVALIHHRGFTLIAEAILPIKGRRKDESGGKKSSEGDTIIYGSDDAGATPFNEDPAFTDGPMQKLAQRLNLAARPVSQMSGGRHLPGSTEHFVGPIDIEGHRGTDGKYYLLDFARLMPPEAPPSLLFQANLTEEEIFQQLRERCVKAEVRDVFCNLMRPTFVASIKGVRTLEIPRGPLCSDALTPFSLHVKDEHHRESLDRNVFDATNFLLKNVLVNFANRLLDIAHAGVEETMPQIIARMHQEGLNVRHLGLVRSKITHELLKARLLSECVARTLKNLFYDEMRTQIDSAGNANAQAFDEKATTRRFLKRVFNFRRPVPSSLLPSDGSAFDEVSSGRVRVSERGGWQLLRSDVAFWPSNRFDVSFLVKKGEVRFGLWVSKVGERPDFKELNTLVDNKTLSLYPFKQNEKVGIAYSQKEAFIQIHGEARGRLGIQFPAERMGGIWPVFALAPGTEMSFSLAAGGSQFTGPQGAELESTDFWTRHLYAEVEKRFFHVFTKEELSLRGHVDLRRFLDHKLLVQRFQDTSGVRLPAVVHAALAEDGQGDYAITDNDEVFSILPRVSHMGIVDYADAAATVLVVSSSNTALVDRNDADKLIIAVNQLTNAINRSALINVSAHYYRGLANHELSKLLQGQEALGAAELAIKDFELVVESSGDSSRHLSNSELRLAALLFDKAEASGDQSFVARADGLIKSASQDPQTLREKLNAVLQLASGARSSLDPFKLLRKASFYLHSVQENPDLPLSQEELRVKRAIAILAGKISVIYMSRCLPPGAIEPIRKLHPRETWVLSLWNTDSKRLGISWADVEAYFNFGDCGLPSFADEAFFNVPGAELAIYFKLATLIPALREVFSQALRNGRVSIQNGCTHLFDSLRGLLPLLTAPERHQILNLVMVHLPPLVAKELVEQKTRLELKLLFAGKLINESAWDGNPGQRLNAGMSLAAKWLRMQSALFRHHEEYGFFFLSQTVGAIQELSLLAADEVGYLQFLLRWMSPGGFSLDLVRGLDWRSISEEELSAALEKFPTLIAQEQEQLRALWTAARSSPLLTGSREERLRPSLPGAELIPATTLAPGGVLRITSSHDFPFQHKLAVITSTEGRRFRVRFASDGSSEWLHLDYDELRIQPMTPRDYTKWLEAPRSVPLPPAKELHFFPAHPVVLAPHSTVYTLREALYIATPQQLPAANRAFTIDTFFKLTPTKRLADSRAVLFRVATSDFFLGLIPRTVYVMDCIVTVDVHQTAVLIWRNASTPRPLAQTPIVLGTWYHMAFSYDGATACALRINGKVVGQGRTQALANPVSGLILGEDPVRTAASEIAEARFNLSLREFRMWSEVVNQANLHERKDKELSLPNNDPSLLLYFKFSDFPAPSIRSPFEYVASRQVHDPPRLDSWAPRDQSTSSWEQDPTAPQLRPAASPLDAADNTMRRAIDQCVLTQRCTYAATNNTRVLQTWYSCATCRRRDTDWVLGICESCAATCHKGHILVPKEASGFYCRCGEGGMPNCCGRPNRNALPQHQRRYDLFEVLKPDGQRVVLHDGTEASYNIIHTLEILFHQREVAKLEPPSFAGPYLEAALWQCYGCLEIDIPCCPHGPLTLSPGERPMLCCPSKSCSSIPAANWNRAGGCGCLKPPAPTISFVVLDKDNLQRFLSVVPDLPEPIRTHPVVLAICPKCRRLEFAFCPQHGLFTYSVLDPCSATSAFAKVCLHKNQCEMSSLHFCVCSGCASPLKRLNGQLLPAALRYLGRKL